MRHGVSGSTRGKYEWPRNQTACGWLTSSTRWLHSGVRESSLSSPSSPGGSGFWGTPNASSAAHVHTINRASSSGGELAREAQKAVRKGKVVISARASERTMMRGRR